MAIQDINEAGYKTNQEGVSTVESTSDEKRDFKMVMSLYDKGKKVRKEFDSDWGTYKDFYNGKQWPLKRPSYKASPNINIIRATIQTILPIMTDTSPGFDYIAREPSDWQFADLVSKVIKSWWQRKGMDHTMVEVIFDSLMYDAGILKVTWDPESEEGLGDVICSVIDPRNVYVPEDAEDFDTKCAWVVQKLYMSIGEIKRKFPDKAEYLKDLAGAKRDSGDKDKRYSGEIELVSPIDKKSPFDEKDNGGGQESDDKVVEVLECWLDDFSEEEYELENEDGDKEIVSKRKYPRGKVVTVIPEEKLVLQSKENPYSDAKKPFVRFIDTLIPRQFWGEGEVEALMEIQKLINKNMAVLIDWMNLMSNPAWIVDDDSGVDPRQLTNQVGLIITKKRGTEVKREQAPSMPPQMFELYNNFRQLADTFSGVHDVTQGRKPTGVTAAEAINELQEAAQTRIRLKERNLQVSLTQMAYLVLSRILQFYTEPRMLRISGKESMPKFEEFYIAEKEDGKYTYTTRSWLYDSQRGVYYPKDWVNGSPSKGIFDVEVKSGTSLPFQKSRMDSLARALYNDGLIDQEEALTMMELPRKEEVIRRMNEEKQQEAQAQQQMPPQGPPPQGI